MMLFWAFAYVSYLVESFCLWWSPWSRCMVQLVWSHRWMHGKFLVIFLHCFLFDRRMNISLSHESIAAEPRVAEWIIRLIHMCLSSRDAWFVCDVVTLLLLFCIYSHLDYNVPANFCIYVCWCRRAEWPNSVWHCEREPQRRRCATYWGAFSNICSSAGHTRRSLFLLCSFIS